MIGLLQLFAFALLVIVVLGTLATVYGITHPPRLTYGVAVARGLPVSPAEAGYAFSEHTLALAQTSHGAPDTTLAWLVKGELSADEKAPIFVVTHGWGESRHASALYLPLLTKLSAYVLLYDTRGHGESSPRSCDVGTTEIDDLLKIIEQIPSILPVEASGARHPIILMGASMGGGISIAAAARSQTQKDGKPIVGVICDGAYRRGMEPIDGHFRRRKYPVWLYHLPVGLYLTFRFTNDQQFDRARHARQLQCPLLMLHGIEDEICPYSAAQEICAAAPRATLISFENSGHLTLLEADKEKFTGAVAQFVRGVC